MARGEHDVMDKDDVCVEKHVVHGCVGTTWLCVLNSMIMLVMKMTMKLHDYDYDYD